MDPEEQHENKRTYEKYRKHDIWIYLVLLLALYAATFGLLPFPRIKVFGAILAAGASYEAIPSFLTGRMRTSGLDATIQENPISFWIQVTLLAVLSVVGIGMIVVG